LGLPVIGGSTDHHVNKPPSGGFVVFYELFPDGEFKKGKAP
jgi:hypothetical protein